MTEFQLAPYKDEVRIRRTRDEIVMRLSKNKAEGDAAMGRTGYSHKELADCVDRIIAKQMRLPTYVNDVYQVCVEDILSENSEYPDLVHLSIRRLDRDVIRDWRDLQEIKNKLVGPECTGVEVFPAESQLVDTANQYHLWVFKDPSVKLPFGFKERLVSDESLSTTKQRKRS